MNRPLTLAKIKQTAQAEGFDLVGVTQIKKFDQKDHYKKYLKKGYHAEMEWLRKSRTLRKNPQQAFPKADSIISLAINYFPGWQCLPDHKGRGVIARYAFLDDYHQIVKKNLDRLAGKINKSAGEEVCLKTCVDSAALLEKEIASQAGLGFIGKNTQLITKRFGSFVFLAEIIVRAKLKSSVKQVKDRCGQCAKCLLACPTKALVKPYVLDARQCISYLTIESQGPIPVKLREKIGLNIFGCDKCQEVCPHNKIAKQNLHPFFQVKKEIINRTLINWLKISEAEFKQLFAYSPIKRAGHQGLIRNIIVALGNLGDPKSLPYLEKFLKSKDSLLAEHADWSIKKIKNKH